MQTHAQITDLIHFHGITLQVITSEGVQYVPAKPLVELASNHWRTAKRTIIEGDNAVLYSSKVIKVHEFAPQGGASATPNEVLCLRLDRIYIYLARVSTNHMKSQGNVQAAEELLELQIEWAQALNDYETKGVAFKDKNKSTRLELIQLIKALNLVKDINENAILTTMIQQVMRDLGYNIKVQPELF